MHTINLSLDTVVLCRVQRVSSSLVAAFWRLVTFVGVLQQSLKPLHTTLNLINSKDGSRLLATVCGCGRLREDNFFSFLLKLYKYKNKNFKLEL